VHKNVQVLARAQIPVLVRKAANPGCQIRQLPRVCYSRHGRTQQKKGKCVCVCVCVCVGVSECVCACFYF
jgi:hypothetical protein